MDDYWHKETLLKNCSNEESAINFDLFCFYDGKEDAQRMIKEGSLPWWTHEKLKICFFRPISEITHRIDYWLWPNSPKLMHIQSIAWYLLLVFFIFYFYRYVFKNAFVASVATFLYAIDDAHAWPIAWLANRNTVIAAMFGILVMIFHHRWREKGDGWSAVYGSIVLLIGILSGEAAVGILGYLIAYAVFMDKGSVGNRVASVLPYFLVVIFWLAIYRWTEMGTFGSGMYVDPVHNLYKFILTVIERGPIFFLGQWGYPPAELNLILIKEKMIIIWYIGIFVFGLIAVGMIPILKHREGRFWGTGMVLSLVVACTSTPNNRHLLFIGIGACGLLALFFKESFDKKSKIIINKGLKIYVVALSSILIFIHLLLPIVLLPIFVQIDAMQRVFVNRPAQSDLLKPDEKGQKFYIINSPGAFFIMTINHYLLDTQGTTARIPIQALATGNTQIKIQRTGINKLEMDLEDGFIANQLDQTARGDFFPMSVGEKVQAPGVVVTVLSLNKENRPQKVVFEFEDALESKQFKFLKWNKNNFVLFKLPSVGEEVIISKLPDII